MTQYQEKELNLEDVKKNFAEQIQAKREELAQKTKVKEQQDQK